jgi:hypothetical protein
MEAFGKTYGADAPVPARMEQLLEVLNHPIVRVPCSAIHVHENWALRADTMSNQQAGDALMVGGPWHNK